MDHDAGPGRLGDRDERLERQMQDLLGLEGVLEHVVGRRHGGLGVAAAQMIVERDVGIPAAGQMLEVREGAGGLEHVVHDHVRCQRLDLVVDGGQLVVVGFDQLRGALGDVRIGGEHDRDRLADMAHLVEREDRLVVKRGAVIGLRDERADVLAGDDPVHAGKRPRRAGVDARMRPCGTVLRTILPCSMPGRRRPCMYSARPVTLARASSRGMLRPTWGMTGISNQ